MNHGKTGAMNRAPTVEMDAMNGTLQSVLMHLA